MDGVSITKVGNQEEKVGMSVEERDAELRHVEFDIQVDK